MNQIIRVAFSLALFGQISFANPFWVKGAAAAPQEKVTAAADRKNCSKILRPLIIKVGFRDIRRRPKRSFINQRFITKPGRYIREMSYGTTCLKGKITRKWYVLPGKIKRYWVPWQNLKVDKSNLRRLVAETLKRVERDYDVSKYDFFIFVLGANAREWGNQGLNTYPGILGWKNDSALITPGGRKLRGGLAIYALSARVGKIFHNIAHILGGVQDGNRVLPDMYDQQVASSSNVKVGQGAANAYRRSQIHMGAWDPMSCNTCPQRPGPPGVSSWTKIRLGWLDQSRIRTIKPGESVDVQLSPLTDRSASTLAIRIQLTPTTYYLVENRQRIGQDRNIPAPGVLIMYADDTVSEPRFGRAPVRLMNADKSIPFLDGAAFDIGKKSTFTDRANGIEIQLVKKIGKSYLIRVDRSQPASGPAASLAHSQMMKPCCDDTNVNYSKDLWSALAKTGLAGSDAKADTPYKGQTPHGTILETITSEVIVGGHKGKVIVKRNYGGKGLTMDAVKADRAKHLKAVTVMFKREAGYDKDNANWFWAKYKADGSLHTNPKGMMLAGRVMKGKDKGCIACHSAVKSQDYIFGKQN